VASKRRPRKAQAPRSSPQRRSPDRLGYQTERPDAEATWNGLRSGARNVAGVTYQVAISADLLVRGQVRTEDSPSVSSLVPEGWEDIDCSLGSSGQLYVQVKERGLGAAAIGAAEVAAIVVHTATSLKAVGGLSGPDRIALVTDGILGSGLVSLDGDGSYSKTVRHSPPAQF
jgi:hypothetical protein